MQDVKLFKDDRKLFAKAPTVHTTFIFRPFRFSNSNSDPPTYRSIDLTLRKERLNIVQAMPKILVVIKTKI
jgi:hypothetical protein